MRTAPLSAAELAPVAEFIEKWTAIGLSTEPIDRDWAERALACFYELAGLAEPWVVWAPCPVSALLSAAVYAAAGSGEAYSEIRDRDDLARLVDRVTRFGLIVPREHLAYERLRDTIGRVVGRALRLRAVTASGCNPALLLPVSSAFSAASRAARYAPIDPTLEKCLATLIAEPVDAASQEGFGGLLRRVLRQVTAGLDERLRAAAEAHLGSPLGLGLAAQLDFAHHVLRLPLDRGFIELSEHCGLFWIADGLCFAAERPNHIKRDPADLLHSAEGPSIQFRSGWSWWHWHGSEINQEIIDAPERITIEAIEGMSARHLRRAMIERYRWGDETHGIPAFLRDAGAIRLDHDAAFGTLWRRALAGDEPLTIIEVVNRTPEPDGSYKHHFLRVDPQLRPILPDGGIGPPQSLTARNAVASTFGLTGTEYMPEAET